MNKNTFINNADRKIVHHCLNMDYHNYSNFRTFQGQTNYLIQTLMNDFISRYKNFFSTHDFIIEWKDDVISLIGYKIIKNIQGLFPFNFYILGNRKKTKKYLQKEKMITKNKISKLSDIVYISCFNPIYYVMSHNYSFNNFSDTYYLMSKFTPTQLMIAAKDFYQIDNHLISNTFKNNEVLNFDNFCNCIIDTPIPKIKLDKPEDLGLTLFKLGENSDINNINFDTIKNTNNIIFWFVDDVNKLFEYNYNPWVKNKDNAPCYNYLNIISPKSTESNKVLMSLLPYYKFDLVGDWGDTNDIENNELYKCLLNIIKNNNKGR